MSTEKLTQDEAKRLIDMLKRALVSTVVFPSQGQGDEFDVVGDTKKDAFCISIYRGRIQPLKYNLGARIKKNGTMLLELHVGQSLVHTNPDGEKINGTHWHVYTEGYGRSYAFPADSILSDQFVDNTIKFLEEFHVVEKPTVLYQVELI